MTQTTQAVEVDTRPMASKDRRTLVFWTFDQLEVDMTMELINDHEPTTLRSQLEI